MGKIICFFLGHKEAIKLQVSPGYALYICDRCNNVFAEKKELSEERIRKKENRKQEILRKKQEKMRKKQEQLEEQLEENKNIKARSSK